MFIQFWLSCVYSILVLGCIYRSELLSRYEYPNSESISLSLSLSLSSTMFQQSEWGINIMKFNKTVIHLALLGLGVGSKCALPT